VIWHAHDDVVEDFDFKKLTGPNEVASDFDVGFGWCRFTARMIVREHDGGGAGHDCQPEYFPGMTQNCVHRSNGHQIVTLDSPTGVEDEYHQTFTFRIEVRMSRNVRLPIGGCLFWRFALLHGVGCGTFPQ